MATWDAAISGKLSPQAVSYAAGPQGVAAKYASTEYQSWSYYAGAPWAHAAGQVLAVVAVAEYSSLPTGGGIQTLLSSGYVSTVPLYADIRDVSGTSKLTVGSYSGSGEAQGQWVIDTAVWPANTPAVLCFGYSAVLGTWLLYINGVQYTLTGARVTYAPVAWNGTELSVGRIGTGVNSRYWKGKIYFAGVTWNSPEIVNGFIGRNPWQVFEEEPLPIWVSSGGSAALTGTITTATEADIVTGGKTIILTLTGDTWVAAGATFDAQRQNIIDGLDSAQAEATGWDAVVKAGQAVTGVVRTSDTVATITLDAFATYDITATETITATIPATAVSLGAQIVASPTFQVTATAAGFQPCWALNSNQIFQGALR